MNPILPVFILILPIIIILTLFLKEQKFRQAFVMISRRQYRQAIDILEKFNSDNGRAVSTCWGLAKANFGLGRYDRALSLLRRIPLSRTDGSQFFTTYEYYSFLSDTLLSLDKYQESIKYLMYLKEKFGDTAKVNHKIGESFYRMEETRKAFHYLNIALGKGAGPETLFLLGIIYYKLGNYSESMVAMKKVMKADPGNQTARVYLGFSFYKLKRYSQALSFLKQSSPPPEIEEMYFSILGFAAFNARDYASCYIYLTKYLTFISMKAPEYRESLYMLGHSAEQIGKFEEAAGFWEQLALTDPAYPGAVLRYQLSRVYLKSRMFKNFLFSPKETFRDLVQGLLEKMHYTLLTVFETTESEVVCLASEDDVNPQFGKRVIIFNSSARPEDAMGNHALESTLKLCKEEDCNGAVIMTVGIVEKDFQSAAGTHKIVIHGMEELSRLLMIGD